jgi:CBS domain containing-hemolysin-like protein
MSPDGSPPTPAVQPVDFPATSQRPGLIERLRTALRRRGAPATRDDLETALATTEAGAGFSPQERSMLRNVLDLRTVRVADVMVPRVDIVAVSIDTSLGDLLRVFREAAHSRLPVYGETLDDPRGMVHIRDFVDYVANRAETLIGAKRRRPDAPLPGLTAADLATPLSEAKILRPVLFVPPSMSAIDLLVKMQATRTHMALVIDEYGGTDGLASIEDLVEVIVGDIEDEHDEVSGPTIVAEGDGVFLADARTPLGEVSKAVGADLGVGDAAEEVATIGGLVVTLAGRVPVRGEIVAGPGELEFEILEADPRRIARLRIHPRRGMSELRRRRARSRAELAEQTPESSPSPAAPASAGVSEQRPAGAAPPAGT